ncbi:galactokinase [Kitasatospora aureofaciens]|uniref:galactokinase n=1 Tax=Kitasatospora aureofaciens TaxID=1894 RepID=UPI001C43A4F9|nr:galactokinase [Kitasatospora aureofaciens]MBV6696657.1 galactokinase [Kitasatospora aureofaciens]
MTGLAFSFDLGSTFAAVFGTDPTGTWAAPGRVNLIGEHTDYNDGFVLPIALPQTVRVTARRRTDGRLRLFSTQGDGGVVELSVTELAPGQVAGWARYPASAVWALRAAGHHVGGADLHVDSDVPTGAGLSSSAALTAATALACHDLYELSIPRAELARIVQRAENEFVGVPCGIMDQIASLCCTEGHALHLDTRDLTQHQIPFDPAAQGLRLLVVDTGVKHDLGDGAYAELRAGCERAATLLGLPALRDLRPDGLAAALDLLPDELRPLVRHVVSENERVRLAVKLLPAGRLEALGAVLTAGHASLRDDFRVSCPETDLVVDTAAVAGARGARMTGGGFGGSVIVLVDEPDVEPVSAAIAAAFGRAGYAEPRIFPALPAAGAHRLC